MSHDRKYDTPEFTTRVFGRITTAEGKRTGWHDPVIPGRKDHLCADSIPQRPRSTADLCNECDLPVSVDDAGPSCGAHILHIECGPWFGCNHCYLVRAEIP